jgi:hypothetical protein
MQTIMNENKEIGKACMYRIQYQKYGYWFRATVKDSTEDTITVEWQEIFEDYKPYSKTLPRKDVFIF